MIVAATLLTPLAAWSQKFAQPQVIPTGNWPAAVYTADVNGDGIADFIYLDQFVTSTSATAHVLVGDGKGGFQGVGQIGTFGNAIAVGDFAGNSGVQIASVFAFGPTSPPQVTVCAVFAIQISIALTNASGVPTGAVQGTICASGSRAPVLGNLTAVKLHNGKGADLLMTDSANNLLYEVSLNTSGATIGAPTAQTFALPDGAGPITAADLNGDGHLDLLVDGQTGFAADVFVGDGSGGLTAKGRFSGLTGVHSLLVQDVNNDGRPDLIAEGVNGRMDIFAGNGDGTFQTTSIGGSGALDGLTGNGGYLVNIANRKTDGALYVVTATPIGISVLLQNANSTWGLDGIYNVGPGRLAAIADFNGDGTLDLAVDSPEGIAIINGRVDGSFTTPTGFSRAFAAGQPAMSSALGVFTASGNVDAVVSTAATQGQLLQGSGNGMFNYLGFGAAPVPTTNQTGPAGLIGTVQVGDFNGDGKLDLAITADGPNALIPLLPNGMLPQVGIVIQPGNGDGTFLAPVFAPVNHVSTCPQALDVLYGVSTVADFNGDGIADLGNRDFNEERIDFGTKIHYAPVIQQYSTDRNCNLHAHDQIVAGDLNNDGAPDLLVQTDGHLVVQLNQGGGTFTFDATQDLSVDGALTTPGQLTAPALSSTFNGPAISTNAGGLGFPAFIGSAVVADLDRDGNNDLIVTYANLSANRAAPTSAAPNYIYIWYGSGGGRFLTSAKHPINPVRLSPSRNFYEVSVADLNGDGIPDLILSDGYILSVQLGKGDGSFGTEAHYLAGQGLNTISVADVNHDGTLDLVVANGGTVWGNPVANLDQPPAAQDVNTGGITVLLNHATPPLPSITASVAASPEPSTFGNAFSVTATIAPSLTSNNPVTGSFTFAVDGIIAGTANISGLSATLTVPANIYAGLTVGSHTLTAVYSGDANWATATFSGTHNVSLIPTTTSLILCVDPPGSNFPCSNPISSTPLISPITMYYGQSVDGVAIESALNLTGTITFYSGASTFCVLNANLLQGSQTCPTNSGFFPAGTTTVTAVYSGDSIHTASTSNGVVVTVLQDPASAVVASSLNPAPLGQAVTFTASVQGNFAPGAGQVIFLDGTTTIGTATLDNTGHAFLTTSSLTVGTHPIRVAFPGSANFLSTTSTPLNQVILPPSTPVPSMVTISSSVDPSTPGQNVTFTATVTLTASYTLFPVGNVTFFDGPTAIGTGLVSALTGQATFATSSLAVGSHPITASYPGLTGNGTTTATILPSTSAVLTQIVGTPTPPGFTLTVTPAPVTIGAGDTGILLVKVQAVGGFNQQVKLTCAGLPQETTCAFVQPVTPAGGGSTTLQVAVSAPHSCDNNTPYFVTSASEPGTTAKVLVAGLFGGGLLFAGIRRRRKMLIGTIFLLLLSLGGFAMISGCGACTDLGTKPGVYSFTVVGTATGSTEVESQTIPLTVTIP